MTAFLVPVGEAQTEATQSGQPDIGSGGVVNTSQDAVLQRGILFESGLRSMWVMQTSAANCGEGAD